jgi:hypothetical protein
VEVKRKKRDPGYMPYTSSEGTLTAVNSQEGSEVEEEEMQEETETEEESSHPSGSTSPEQFSSLEDDQNCSGPSNTS